VHSHSSLRQVHGLRIVRLREGGGRYSGHVVWQLLVGVLVALLAVWVLLVVVLVVVKPKGLMLKEAMRLLPDTLRLLRRLAADSSLPHGVRVRLWLLFAYLVMPIDLIPDFLPVVGYADDAIIVAVVLRSVVRRAGLDAVRRHWPGSEDGLAALCRAARLPVDGPTRGHDGG
jgi:uncharacterized membrane protein YkvA (DUF1232 family)